VQWCGELGEGCVCVCLPMWWWCVEEDAWCVRYGAAKENVRLKPRCGAQRGVWLRGARTESVWRSVRKRGSSEKWRVQQVCRSAGAQKVSARCARNRGRTKGVAGETIEPVRQCGARASAVGGGVQRQVGEPTTSACVQAAATKKADP